MQAKSLEKILKATANRRRISIMRFLRFQERATVGEVAREISLSFKATSKHLNLLYNSGFLERSQKGLYMRYSIIDKPKKITKTILTII